MVSDRSIVKKEKAEYTVLAVKNAIGILELLGNFEHELSLNEIASKLKLTRSNANKILANLERFGYIEYNQPASTFRLGVKTFQISQSYMDKLNLASTSISYLQKLNLLCNESVYIAVLRKTSVVYLHVIETKKPVKVNPRIGNISEAYATASGKVQLSFIDEGEIRTLYPSILPKLTDKTIDNIESLINELKDIREKGFATDIEEYEVGVHCVAAPIVDFMGSVIGAISVSAPKERMKPERVDNEILPNLLKVAEELSVKFGYSPKN